jgi:hypothetical protein
MLSSVNIGLSELALLGGLNVILGILVAVLSFRLSKLNRVLYQTITSITELESRISRLEVLTNLSEAHESKKTAEVA